MKKKADYSKVQNRLQSSLEEFFGPSSPFEYPKRRRGRPSYVTLMLREFNNLWWEDYYNEHPEKRPKPPIYPFLSMLGEMNKANRIKKQKRGRTVLVKYNQILPNET